MTARIIDGKARAEEIVKQLQSEISSIENKYKKKPSLAVILVGENPASKVYVSSKHKKALEADIHPIQIDLADSISEEALLVEVEKLNNNPDVNGILVQLPLPKHIDEQKIINAINPSKDVDGFHPINSGKLFCGIKDGFIPSYNFV